MKTTNEVALSHGIVLNNDNAKKFATRLKKTLKENSIDFKTSKCYDILAKTFGSSNWHELSQHLKDTHVSENIQSTPQNDNKKLNSLFDLPWVEFKYIVSKMTTHLDFDFHTKEFLEILLDIVHENQPRSEIYWDKLNEFLESSEINFRSNLEIMPIHDYTTVLNPTLNKDQVEKFIKRIIKSGSSEGYFRIKFSPEKVEAFFYMLQFLKNENFILRDIHTNFAVSEVLRFEDNNYKSDYRFINTLINLADINNDFIEFNKQFYKRLTFHDLIIQLYAKTNLLNHIEHAYIDYTKIKSFTEEIYNNHDFISYLFSHLKKYVYNSVNISSEKSNIVSQVSQYPQGINKTMNVIHYNMNYVPHGYILKHELENMDFSDCMPELVNPETNEIIKSDCWLKLEIQINEKNGLIKHNKFKVLEYLTQKKFKPEFTQGCYLI